MNGNLIYLLGVLCIAIGTILTYWGNSIKSDESSNELKSVVNEKKHEIEELGSQATELVGGKNTLIGQNSRLEKKIESYQINLDQKEKEIQELEEKASRAARGITSNYDFNGAKRETKGSGQTYLTLGGPEAETFSKIIQLAKEENYSELIEVCK